MNGCGTHGVPALPKSNLLQAKSGSEIRPENKGIKPKSGRYKPDSMSSNASISAAVPELQLFLAAVRGLTRPTLICGCAENIVIPKTLKCFLTLCSLVK